MPFAIAYDWLANHLTSSDRDRYINYMLNQVEMFGFVGRSGACFPKLYDLSNLNPATGLRALFIGFAIYNDKIALGEINQDNKEAKKIIKDYGGFFKRVVEGFKMVGGETGGYHEDFGHTVMALGGILPLLELWYKGTEENLYTDFNTIHYWPLLNYMMAKPNKTALFSNYTDFNNYRLKSKYFLIANRYQDDVIQTMAENDFGRISNGQLWEEILWKDMNLKNDVIVNETLSMAKIFKPTGWLFIRSGWDMGSVSNPSDEFWMSIFSGRYFYTHKCYMMNSFGIFFKGDLIVNNSLDGPNKPTKYHNTIMLDNENQREESGPKDGSPLDIIGWKNFEEGTKSDLSGITKFETNDDYSYALAEAHEIYDLAILDYWTREFVYLNSSANGYYFLTYDRMTTDDALTKKKNMLNFYNLPKIDGREAISGNECSGVNIIQADAGGASADNLDGRAFIKVLLPKNSNILTEQILGNESIDQKKAKPRWCMFITPSIQSRHDNFLNVIQITDSANHEMTSVIEIDAETMVGALISDPTSPRIVLFSQDQKGADVNSVNYSVSYLVNLTGKHLLADMKPGRYDVYKNGVKVHSDLSALEKKGTLYFEANGDSSQEESKESVFQVVRTGEIPAPIIITGDINADGVVNVLDVQLCVNVALGIDTDADRVKKANVNGDGSVDVLDIQAVVNVILNSV